MVLSLFFTKFVCKLILKLNCHNILLLFISNRTRYCYGFLNKKNVHTLYCKNLFVMTLNLQTNSLGKNTAVLKTILPILNKLSSSPTARLNLAASRNLRCKLLKAYRFLSLKQRYGYQIHT